MEDQPTNTPSSLPSMFRKPVWKKWLWPVVGVVVILVLVAGGSSYYSAKNEKNTAATVPSDTVTTTDGLSWLTEPQKLADLGLFTNRYRPNSNTYSDADLVFDPTTVAYYKVGSIGSEEIILANAARQDMFPDSYGLFVKKSANSYLLIKNHSTDYYEADGSLVVPEFSSLVKIDSTTVYDSVVYQKTLKVKNQSITNENKRYGFYPTLAEDTTRPLSVYTTTDFGTVYIQRIGQGDGFELQIYVLRLPDQTTLVYQSRPPFITDDSIPSVTWSDSNVNKDTYRADGIGSCGSASGLAVMNTTGLDGLSATGKTKDDQVVYEFSNSDNPTLQYFYKLYGVDSEGKPVAGALTLEQYRAKHAVFVWKDALGRSIVFNSTVYGSQTECGKPVIYLYPTSPTMVSVEVDAKITKSDPAYGNGWNVLAMPSGKLFSGSGSYDSLFWEGTGKLYPTTNSGFVVSQADLTQSLTNQLHQLGLNTKESADFLDFWLPKMPTTPYVRVTWFGKNQMDQLAPLTVLPKPDTVIRIFMDFEGLSQPIAISSQRLSAPARRGFTVVEWGGLLRNSTAIQ